VVVPRSRFSSDSLTPSAAFSRAAS
jgi:hypothetical protein